MIAEVGGYGEHVRKYIGSIKGFYGVNDHVGSMLGAYGDYIGCRDNTLIMENRMETTWVLG